MTTLITYNRPVAWFNPFLEFNIFEPVICNSTITSNEVIKSKDKYEYKLNLNGFKKKNLKMSINKNTITIEGNKTSKTGGLFKRNKEYSENSFMQQFTIKSDMDVDNIKAKFRKGILNIEIPKKKEFINYKEIKVSGAETEKPETVKERRSKIKNIFRKLLS